MGAGRYPRATRPTPGLIQAASRPGYRLPPLAAMPPQLQVPRPLDRVPGNCKQLCYQGDWRHLPGTRWRTCISCRAASLDRPPKTVAVTGLLGLSNSCPNPLDKALDTAMVSCWAGGAGPMPPLQQLESQAAALNIGQARH